MKDISTEDLKNFEIIQNKIKDISSHFGSDHNHLIVLGNKSKPNRCITRNIFNYFILKCIEVGYNLYKVMEKEIKIVPPEGYEIDKENSTFEYIKFKPKIIKFKDNKDVIGEGFYITNRSNIVSFSGHINECNHHKVFATEAQAKSALAYARLSQIIANDKRFGGPITDAEWNDLCFTKNVIKRWKFSISVDYTSGAYSFLAFHTKSQAELFMKENMDLIREYYCL